MAIASTMLLTLKSVRKHRPAELRLAHGVGRMMTFSVAMVFGWIDLVRVLSILLIFGASVLRLLARDALFFLSL